MHPATPFNVFRLLVPLADAPSPNGPTIEIAGGLWTTTAASPIPEGDRPDYVCISYSWGPGRTANPFEPDQMMSDRVIPVLDAAIQAVRPAAIWIDAFCVPAREPERTACLRSMGAVYARAARVVVVLSKACSVLVGKAARPDGLDEADLLLLEKDDWAGRVWTYHEFVNSKSCCFTAEGCGGSTTGMLFLNAVGTALEKYKKTRLWNNFTLRALHPRLDNLEDTIADWLTADFAVRSAYQAMSSMDRRTSREADDYLTAIIGAISTDPHSDRYDAQMHPAEHFIQVCERKGDYSYLFSVAPRGNAPGRSWRPLAGPIRAIQPWHTFGDGLSGRLEPSCLRLDGMCRMPRGTLASSAGEFISKWLLRNSDDTPASDDMPSQILTRLRRAGFTGCGGFIELEGGYFFPLSEIVGHDDAIVFVAVGLRWVHGGPGLIATRLDGGLHQFREVGVFVGPHPQSGESIDLT